MGRRIISFILCLVLACANIAAAENAADEYAWLDDLTINQLKALDKEIHKRIPAESTSSKILRNSGMVRINATAKITEATTSLITKKLLSVAETFAGSTFAGCFFICPWLILPPP